MSTTVRVTDATRAALRELAEADGLTMDEMIHRLARAERQRRMGEALAHVDYSDEDSSWLDMAAGEAGRPA